MPVPRREISGDCDWQAWTVMPRGLPLPANFVPTSNSKVGQVETVLDNEIQSQPCITIHHTHNETMEQSSCYVE
eukprot:scaffold9764_cov36-Cyclotella_meneghiniana.AAC.1